jgi:hypothetical protein
MRDDDDVSRLLVASGGVRAKNDPVCLSSCLGTGNNC